jgi:hypothetical protein
MQGNTESVRRWVERRTARRRSHRPGNIHRLRHPGEGSRSSSSESAPSGDLFGVPHSGKSFRIMAIDIQTIKDSKIARTYHLENWLSALGQLRAK